MICLYKEILLRISTDLKRSPFEIAKMVSNSIGVISPYKEQVNLLRNKFISFLSSHPDFRNGGPRLAELKKFIQIDSVDGFQGA